jgi:hypothetical protein
VAQGLVAAQTSKHFKEGMTMKRRIWTVIGLLVSILLITPLVVSAEDLNVAPISWDFGDVELLTSRSHIFTLSSLGPTAVWVYVAYTTPTATSPYLICTGNLPYDYHCGVQPGDCTTPCDFAVTAISEPLPNELPTGSTIDVEVTFRPSALGFRHAFLFIQSNDSILPPGPQVLIPLTGWGVDATAPPGELMADLLAFFNASVTGGSLTGLGPGSSASHRLKAFKNMLKASSDLIEVHAYDLACTQLQDALNRTDGLAPPPDFVAGESMVELASKITGVRNALGCP